MDILSKFNLPSYLKNKKTFADMSKAISDRFKGRNDSESVQTMNDLQGRLRNAQEFVKEQQEINSRPPGEFKKGGKLEYSSSYNAGGDIVTDGAAKGPGVGSIMGAASGALELASMLSDTKVDTSGRTDAQYTNRGGNALKGAGAGAKVGGAIAPGIGHAIGAIGGAIMGGFSGPSDKKIAKAKSNFTYGQLNSSEMNGTNIAKYGSDLDDPDDPTPNYDGPDYDDNIWEDPNQPFYTELNKNGFVSFDENKEEPNSESTPEETTTETTTRPRAMSLLTPSTKGPSFSTPEEELEKDSSEFMENRGWISPTEIKYYGGRGNGIESNIGEALRYAPSAMNIAQLAGLKKPKDIAFGRSDRKYQKQFVDEQGMQNSVRQATSSNRDAILSSSGGSGSKSRAALLASQLQGTKALSSAYQQAGVENRQEERNAQEFDSNTEKFNIGQQDKSLLTNMQREAGFQTNKSRLLSQLGNDLGGVGREEMYKRFPELAGLGYDYKGRKIKKKKK